jgi:glutathione peroxidase-family protein
LAPAAAALLVASLAWPAALHAACAAVPKAPLDADSPADVLDKPARAWTFERWVDTKPLTLASLQGRVVLIRWFNTNCKYCGNTLPSLEALRTKYAAQGLVVVGVFHPKPPHPVSDTFVKKTARELGFNGPLAVDETWSTLNRWWLDGHADRNWTSVSFLVDRDGVVRWAHGGGEYHPSTDPRHASCDASYAELERTIRRLLDDRAAAR